MNCLTEAADHHRASGPSGWLASALSSIAVCSGHLGEHARALTAATEAVSVAEQAGDRNQHAESLKILGEIATYRGDFAEAEQTLRQAWKLSAQNTDRNEQTDVLVQLGVNAVRAGAPSAALEFFDQAQDLLAGQDRNRWALTMAQYTGDAHLALGDAAGARKHYELVLASREDSDTLSRSCAAHGMARLVLSQTPPDRAEARRWLREAQVIMRDAQAPPLEREIAAALADVGEG